jgi:hypothetical protein
MHFAFFEEMQQFSSAQEPGGKSHNRRAHNFI